MIGYHDYIKIKNNYCVCYFGTSDEYLVQLDLLYPLISARFSGLNIYIGCKDNVAHYLSRCDRLLKLSEIKIRRPEFAHIRELRFDGTHHPIEHFIEECGIKNISFDLSANDFTEKAVVITQGSYPTVNLTDSQTERLKIIAKERGYHVEVDGAVQDAGLVMGVESVGLFQAASAGLKTILVPTGVGTQLYKKMFPYNEILNL